MQSRADADPAPPEGLSEDAAHLARSLRRPSLAPAALGALAACLDGVTVALALWFADFAAAGDAVSGAGAAAPASLAAAGVMAAIWVARGYKPLRLRRAVVGWFALVASAMFAALGGALLGVWSAEAAPFAMCASVALAVATLPARALSAAVAGWALDCGLTDRRAVIAGGGAGAAELIRGLAANPSNDIRICGIFDDRDDGRSPPVVVGVPKIGAIGDLAAFTRAAEIDMLIVTLPLTAERRIRQILDVARLLPLDVRMSAYSSGYRFRRRSGGAADDRGLIAVMRRPLDGARRLSKRALDIALAAPALAAFAPVLLAAALAIRIESRGPILYSQRRYGYNQRPISVWKLRSMYHEHCDAGARNSVSRDDPRVTRVGRFLRKWSIDELPQLFNVLAGDLSLVGPRPHAVGALSRRRQSFAEIVEGYAARHRVPPGLTGWAQIHGWRGEIDEPETLRQRIAHDLYYIENWSLWLDLYVLIVTPFSLFDTRRAY